MFKTLAPAFQIWNVIRGFSSGDLRRKMQFPIQLAIFGAPPARAAIRERIGNPAAASEFETRSDALAASYRILIDADQLAALSEQEVQTELGRMVTSVADHRIALAAQVPYFRPLVATQLSHERAIENGKIAALSALPGVVPMTEWLLPVTSGADMIVLTRNQIALLLEISACYGKPPEPQARLKELFPVIGGAFGWRAIARELAGLVPGGFGVAVKAAMAYAGTYTVGRAASYYYAANGEKMTAVQLQTTYKGALKDAASQVKVLISRK